MFSRTKRGKTEQTRTEWTKIERKGLQMSQAKNENGKEMNEQNYA